MYPEKDEHANEQKEKAKEEDGACSLSRPETVLDNTEAVLAVGERRRGHEDWRPAADGAFQARA